MAAARERMNSPEPRQRAFAPPRAAVRTEHSIQCHDHGRGTFSPSVIQMVWSTPASTPLVYSGPRPDPTRIAGLLRRGYGERADTQPCHGNVARWNRRCRRCERVRCSDGRCRSRRRRSSRCRGRAWAVSAADAPSLANRRCRSARRSRPRLSGVRRLPPAVCVHGPALAPRDAVQETVAATAPGVKE